MRLAACGASDRGRAREHNEDFLAVDEESGIFVVADGMGGHRHGEVASELAVGSIRHSLARSAGDDPRDLRRAIEDAHRELMRAVERDGALTGMGTTVVTLVVRRRGAFLAHVGDSRAYRLRGGRLELLTDDHTWVNEQVSAGRLSRAQARSHPLRNVVTRALGGGPEVAVDVRELSVAAGDLYLLCTDGLTSMVDDETIASLLAGGGEIDALCGALIDEANRRGGMDNITVVLLRVAG